MNAAQERSEDLAWMADHHETPKEAARRLGLTAATLRRWCERNDTEVWERLLRNERVRKGLAA